MKTYLEINEIQELEKVATCMRDKLLIRILATRAVASLRLWLLR